MKTNVFILVVVVLLSACHSRSRTEKVVENDSVQIQQAIEPVKAVEPISDDSLFYKEVFNKEGLSLGSWEDSTIIANVGESTDTYPLPVLIQRGETTNYYFYFQTTNEKWPDGTESNGVLIYFKLKGTPKTGKTLAEDRVNEQQYDWMLLSDGFRSKIEVLLYQKIKYPEKQFLHKENVK